MKRTFTMVALLVLATVPLLAGGRRDVRYVTPYPTGPQVGVSVQTPYGGGTFFYGTPAPVRYVVPVPVHPVHGYACGKCKVKKGKKHHHHVKPPRRGGTVYYVVPPPHRPRY